MNTPLTAATLQPQVDTIRWHVINSDGEWASVTAAAPAPTRV